MFVHLNIHSVYSAMRGLISFDTLIKLAKYNKMDTLALTDINGLWGFIKYVQYCKINNVFPIAGTNLITDKEDIILLVENQNGYENICRLISAVHENPKIELKDILRLYSSGIFILSHKASTLESLKKIIPDSHLFVELRPGVKEKKIHQLAKKFKLEMVATGDVYFNSKKDYKSYLILNAISRNIKLDQLEIKNLKSEHHWFRNEAQMIQLFPNSLSALNNSQYLADRCKTDWTFINTIFPGLSLKENYQSNKELKKRVYKGAKVRYKDINQEIDFRIKYELDIVIQKGFSTYFLIVQDIVMQTRSTIGRGSAAASIISYCLFITQVDPLAQRLQFERFIHPERKDMPDIDVDFPWDERDNILQYVFKKYGKNQTAMVSNQVFLKPRSSIREVGKVYGLSNEEIKDVTKRISWYSSKRDLKKWIKGDVHFSNINIDEKLLDVLRESEKIIGVLRYSSVHPGGVVIVPDEIKKYVPVLMAPKGIQIVEWEKDQVEDSGLLKIDLLGNRSLAVVRDTIKQINFNYGFGVSKNKYLDYHKVQPVGDIKTQALMKSGKTMGIFYIESPATRQLLAKSRLVDFEHVVIYSSIIRPAANKYINIMLERIHGRPWSLIHPDLSFLKESYGIMVYEEQVSMAVMTMTDFGYAKAELLRKTISRNKNKKAIQDWEEKFNNSSIKRGYKDHIIKEVWEMITSFIGYSFCKPHSASYAMLSFTCAYLKAHYPAEFLASVISNQGGFYSSYAYMSESRRFGIKVLRPDINKSEWRWVGIKNKIRMGFMSIQKLKRKVVNIITDERKTGEFQSLNDFLLRVDLDFADAIIITNSGCFKRIEPKLRHRDISYLVAGFYLQNSEKTPLNSFPKRSDLNTDEYFKLELESFGYPLSIHPIVRYRSILSHKIKYAKDIHKYIGNSIYLIGLYITKKQTRTRKSKPMSFLTLEDETDIFECVLFPEVFIEFGDILNWETLFIIRGVVESSFGVCSLRIEKIASLQSWLNKISRQKSSKKLSSLER